MKNGVKLIAQERNRQIRKEGYTKEHDDQHQNGELSIAAACYALNKLGPGDFWKLPFPWNPEYDKREKFDRLRSLVVAGALIVAQIDRELNDMKANKHIQKLESAGKR